MPDDLYERDILVWSGTQADLLRRLAAGERVNDAVDWPNLIDEVETVGRSELRACESLLLQALLHLVKLRQSPESPAAPHWRSEVTGFLGDARRTYTLSMRQRIDIDDLWSDAVRRAVAASADASAALPELCPFSLDDLLAKGAVATLLVGRIGA